MLTAFDPADSFKSDQVLNGVPAVKRGKPERRGKAYILNQLHGGITRT